jgi:hypothetical protein
MSDTYKEVLSEIDREIALYHNPDPSYNGIKEDFDYHNRLMNTCCELKVLCDSDKKNDYFFLQYLGSILDFIERSSKGCLTDNGRSSLKIDISPIFVRLKGEIELGHTLPQKDLVRFCLYMTFAFAVCVLFKGMAELSKEEGCVLLESLPIPVQNDFADLSERVEPLVVNFKKILDFYSGHLNAKYRKIYNEEKREGFLKPIFTEQIISNTEGRPSDIKNAKEFK